MMGRVLQLDPAAHKVTDALLPWFVNGTLDGDELSFVQKHLSRCASCQREVEWLRDLHAACIAGEADPDASSALRRLRRRLEQRPRDLGPMARLRYFWGQGRPWSRWLIATQLAVIIALGSWILAAYDRPELYRTLGASNATAPSSGKLVVVFDPATTEADLRRMLRDAGARIVDGPTEANAYVLDVPAQREAQALRALRAERAAVLVEQLGPQGLR
jgi:hypothetical protein